MKHSHSLCLLLLLSLSLWECQGQVPKQEKKEIVTGSVALNRKVVWSFSPCGDIQVNDKKLQLGKTLKEWVAALGPYDRYSHPWHDAYTWDKYGLIALTEFKKDTIFQMHIVFHFESDRDSNDYHPIEDSIHIEAIRAEISARPKPVFSGGVLLDSVVLGRGMSIKEFNNLSDNSNRAFRFRKDIFPHRFSFYPRDCPSPIAYVVELSENFKDVEQIIVDNLPNTVWNIEQELKQEEAEKQKY